MDATSDRPVACGHFLSALLGTALWLGILEALVKGGSLLHMKQFLVEEHGEQKVSQWLSTLDGELMEIMSLPLPAAWYPFDHYVRIERAAVDQFYNGNLRAAERIGAYDLRKNINRFIRIMLRGLNVTFLLDKTSQMWSHSVTAGEAVVVRDEDGKGATLEIRGIKPIDEVWYYDMIGSVREGLLLCGAKSPDVRLEKGNGPDGLTARFHSRWR